MNRFDERHREYVFRTATTTGGIERYVGFGRSMGGGWKNLQARYPGFGTADSPRDEMWWRTCRAALAAGYTLLLVPPDSTEDTREKGLHP